MKSNQNCCMIVLSQSKIELESLSKQDHPFIYLNRDNSQYDLCLCRDCTIYIFMITSSMTFDKTPTNQSIYSATTLVHETFVASDLKLIFEGTYK